MSSLTDAAPAAHDAQEASAARASSRRRTRRSPITRDGLSTLVFLLPFLIVFGVFAWYPIVRALVMSFQDTNLVSDPVWVGLQNFQRVLADPMFGIAVKNTLWFTFLALVFGFPIPIVLGGPHERGPPRPRPVQRPRLPAGRGPAGRRGAAVAVLLRRRRRPACSTRSSAGSASARCRGSRTPAWRCRRSCIEATWAAAGATVIIYLAALLGVPPELYDAAEVDGASHLAEDPPRHAAPAAGHPVRHADPAADRDRADVPEPFLFTGGGPANATMTVLLLIYKYAFQNSLGGDYGDGGGAERDAGGLPGRVHGRLLLG